MKKKYSLKEALSEIGKKGGAAGTGKAKSRGDSAYYKNLALKRKRPRKDSL
jgi:hypothetical protein